MSDDPYDPATWIRLDYMGRAYPTPEQARTRMRKTLEITGVPFEEVNIVAVNEAPGAICPWGAYAWVKRKDWDSRQRGALP